MTDALADGFAAVSLDEWEAAARGARSRDDRLVTELEDHIEVKWLYTSADAVPGAVPSVRGGQSGVPWAIRQETGARTRGRANAQILEDLAGGASEVALRIDASGVSGIPATTVDELDEVLGEVYVEMAPVALDAGGDGLVAARSLCQLWERRELVADDVRGSLRLDPLAWLARGERSEDDVDDDLGEAMVLMEEVRSRFRAVHVLAVDTSPYVDAGAGATLELALAMATAIAYLRAGESAGAEPAAVAERLEFTVSVGPDQFLEIAKLRALRRLWASVLGQCDVPPAQRRSPVYALTSRRMLSSLDPWVNLLRNCSAAFAAVVGGADGLTVLPFDAPLGEPDGLGRRMARNTQLVLLEEASLARVADAAGGSWYVESLTDQLARGAWAQLQALEAGGGMVGALRSGAIAERLQDAASRRRRELSRRTRRLTGVNTFPLLGDDGVDRDGACAPPLRRGGAAGGLAPHRDAHDFEQLRRRAESLPADGVTVGVLLACMGPLSAHGSVATWARSFFESGGIAAVPSGLVPDSAAQCALLREHALRAAVLCPGRDARDEDTAELAGALRAAGAHTIYIAGERDDAHAHALGADAGVADGTDMVTLLTALLDRFAQSAA